MHRSRRHRPPSLSLRPLCIRVSVFHSHVSLRRSWGLEPTEFGAWKLSYLSPVPIRTYLGRYLPNDPHTAPACTSAPACTYAPGEAVFLGSPPLKLGPFPLSKSTPFLIPHPPPPLRLWRSLLFTSTRFSSPTDLILCLGPSRYRGDRYNRHASGYLLCLGKSCAYPRSAGAFRRLVPRHHDADSCPFCFQSASVSSATLPTRRRRGRQRGFRFLKRLLSATRNLDCHRCAWSGSLAARPNSIRIRRHRRYARADVPKPLLHHFTATSLNTVIVRIDRPLPPPPRPLPLNLPSALLSPGHRMLAFYQPILEISCRAPGRRPCVVGPVLGY